MRRSLDTEENNATAPLLTVPLTVIESVAVRELHTTTCSTHAVLVSAEAGTHAREAVASQVTLELARRKKIRQRGRAIETALNSDGGPYQQFATLFETFALALASGMAEEAALLFAIRDAPEGMKALFSDMSAQLGQGVSLLQALQQRQDALPDIVIPIMEQGTLYGTLENASRQLAHALKRLARVEEKFEYSALNPGVTIPLVVGGFLLLSLPIIYFFLFPLYPDVPYLVICTTCLSGIALSWKLRFPTGTTEDTASDGVASRAEGRRQWLCAAAARGGALVTYFCCALALRGAHQRGTGGGGAQYPQRALRADLVSGRPGDPEWTVAK